MTCDEYRAAVLSGEHDPKMDRHLAGCADCRSEESRLRETLAHLSSEHLWEEPPPGLEDRVVGLIAGAGRPTATSPPSRRRRAYLGAAAVVVALGLALTAGLLLRNRAPDWSVPVAGAGEATAARATAMGWNTPAGTKVVLDVEGLPPAPDGHLYEVWFSKGPIHISAGTFRSAETDVELLIGVRRADYPRIWVTLEPIDEDESPSPATVLDTGPAQ